MVARSPGTRLGRYMLLDELGRGGMGVVMAAYDHELDRKVALKLLEPSQREAGRGRMHREAQALAQLQHPNVVSVFEVGQLDDTVYLAMEYVEGETWSKWSDRTPRTWREVLDVGIRAGRGLAAAHDVGLVHRDFKPSNVIVGRDGRVRVLDFGIAIATGAPSTEDLADPQAVIARLSAEPSGPRLAASLTETGAVLGTPMYMAPEQFAGQRVDAKTDQWAFCVTLFRLLYKKPPFGGRNLEEIRRSIIAGDIPPASTAPDVPTWLRRVLLRGLEVDVARRWPSMGALLGALERRLARRRNGWLLAGAAAAVTLAVVAASSGSPSADADCATPADRLAGVWDDARRASLRSAFEGTGVPYWREAFERTSGRLDDQAMQWGQVHEAACSHAGDPAEADLQRSCLGLRLSQMRALVDVLAAADESVVARATEAAAELRPASECEDIEALTSGLAPPPGSIAADVAEVRDSIARVDASMLAGQYLPAFEDAVTAVSDAEALEYPPVVVEAKLRLGLAQFQLGRLAAAEASLGDAALTAIAARHDEVAARASTKLAFVLGYKQARHEEGLVWARHAEAAVQRVGERSPIHAEHMVTVGAIESSRANYPAAIRAFGRALDIRVELHGFDHPAVASIHNNLGSAYVLAGDYEAGREQVERALEIWESIHGLEHPNVATALNSLAVIFESGGELAKAQARYEQALEIREKLFDEDSVHLALCLDNLGSVLARRGQYERSRELSQRALDIRERKLGPEHPHTASSLVNLGIVSEKEGRYPEAVQLQERALSIFEASLGPEHPYVASSLTALGRSQLGAGRTGVAVELLERALAIRTTQSASRDLAETRLALADALWSAGDQLAARRQAEQARSELSDAPAARQADAQRWLDDHPLDG